MNGIRAEIIYKDLKFWNNLSEELGLREIRILELVYKNKVYMLNNLIKELKIKYKINFSKTTIIKILNNLNKKGVIQIIKGKPLFINEIIGLDKNIKTLLIISKERYKLK